ncbi:MAG: SDR family NAD(P)-dependent oxidoreductase [Candidatus Aenigmarchaeota archaeon]|nr:SDR family NAD(P)-dependent oxidoreductase [Candidatus Aenigmarchaeota archaeon]
MDTPGKVLVTGGCGFIGLHLVRRLHSEGFQVRVLGTKRDAERVKRLPEGVEFLKGDVRSQNTCRKAVKGCDAVSHLSAMISFDKPYQESQAWGVNVGGTFNMLNAAMEENVSLFHYMGTGLVLGNIDSPHKASEEWPPRTPRSTYAASKLVGEIFCRHYHGVYGLPTVITRTFNVYGPGQNPHSRGAMISNFIWRTLRNEPPIISGDGRQAKDWLYIDDVTEALYRALTAGPAGETIHVCSGIELSVKDIAKKVIEICGKNFEPVFLPQRYADFERSCGDNSKARQLLGWEPKTGLEEGLRKTVEYLGAI